MRYTSYGVPLNFQFGQWFGRFMILLPLSQETHTHTLSLRSCKVVWPPMTLSCAMLQS